MSEGIFYIREMAARHCINKIFYNPKFLLLMEKSRKTFSLSDGIQTRDLVHRNSAS